MINFTDRCQKHPVEFTAQDDTTQAYRDLHVRTGVICLCAMQ